MHTKSPIKAAIWLHSNCPFVLRYVWQALWTEVSLVRHRATNLLKSNAPPDVTNYKIHYAFSCITYRNAFHFLGEPSLRPVINRWVERRYFLQLCGKYDNLYCSTKFFATLNLIFYGKEIASLTTSVGSNPECLQEENGDNLFCSPYIRKKNCVERLLRLIIWCVSKLTRRKGKGGN